VFDVGPYDDTIYLSTTGIVYRSAALRSYSRRQECSTQEQPITNEQLIEVCHLLCQQEYTFDVSHLNCHAIVSGNQESLDVLKHRYNCLYVAGFKDTLLFSDPYSAGTIFYNHHQHSFFCLPRYTAKIDDNNRFMIKALYDAPQKKPEKWTMNKEYASVEEAWQGVSNGEF